MSSPDPTISAADWAGAAWLLRCDVPACRTIGIVETAAFGPFTDDGKPTVLFERHVFDRLTTGKHRGAFVPGGGPIWGNISLPTPGGYGPESKQHERLDAAAKLDRDAALRSASWGTFQIMGFNFRAAGFPDVQAFVNAMYRSAADHLRAFACLVHSNPALEEALRKHDWPTVKRLWNGPAPNDYVARLNVAWQVANSTSP